MNYNRTLAITQNNLLFSTPPFVKIAFRTYVHYLPQHEEVSFGRVPSCGDLRKGFFADSSN
jgi:hypothetical protein